MTESEELELLELEELEARGKNQPKISKTESALRGAAQGLSFGFSDEITAALEKLAGKDYDKSLEETRALYKLAQKENPVTYGASELGGGLATSFVPGVGVARNAGLARNVLSGVGQAALSGAGYSEGDLEDRGQAALKSGAIGGALGTGSALAVKGMQKLAPKFATLATGATGRELQNKFKPGSGEDLLKTKTVGWFTSPKNIAERAGKITAESSDDIGKSLKGIDPISKDQIMANLFTERAKLSGNEGNAKAISILDKEIEQFAKSPKMRDAQDIWNVKKTYEDKVHWLARKTKPNTAQANEKVAKALRNAVADVAEYQSPELAKKFAGERQLYSMYAPIKEAAEREAATLDQRKLMGMLDTAIGISGAGAGLATGRDPAESLGLGLGAAALRRGVAPRLPSFTARAFNNPAAQETALRIPVSLYRSLLGEDK